MDEIITRAAAIYHLQKRLYEAADNNLGITADAGRVFEETASDRIETWIREIPAEKIVRCKDCKYYRTEECYIHIERLWELKPTDYCSQAERK